jgi:uncharacterized protein (TIGR00255 family)
MVQSMTGYSRVSRHTSNGLVTAEARSTNHRYLEISQRLPDGCGGVEGQIAQMIRAHLQRGRVDVTVTVQSRQAAVKRVVCDTALAEAYHAALLELNARFGLKGQVTLDQLLTLPRLMDVVEDQDQRQAVWPAVRRIIEEVVAGLIAMRKREGQRLVKDLRTQTARIRAALKAIRARLPRSAAQQKRRLHERVAAIVGASSSSVTAQIQEALATVKDVDIHEELIRLESHLGQLPQLLGSGKPIGKTLDFLAQELMREANTMGAKANDAMIAKRVIDIKGAIERIREQAQNLE